MEKLKPQYKSGKLRAPIDNASCSWVVKRLYQLMDSQAVSTESVAIRAGVDATTMVHWRTRRNPNFNNIEACLNALGYELIVRKKK